MGRGNVWSVKARNGAKETKGIGWCAGVRGCAATAINPYSPNAVQPLGFGPYRRFHS